MTRALTHIAGEARVLAELRSRTPKRGMRKALAYKAGISESHISNIATGARPISITLAEELGFMLAWVRAEDLRLAGILEREMGIEWPLPSYPHHTNKPPT